MANAEFTDGCYTAEHRPGRTEYPGLKHTLALEQSKCVINHPALLVQTAHEGRKEQGVTDDRVKLRNPMNPENVESGRNPCFY